MAICASTFTPAFSVILTPQMYGPSRRSADVVVAEILGWLLLAAYLTFWGVAGYFHFRGDPDPVEKTVALFIPFPTDDGSSEAAFKKLLMTLLLVGTKIIGLPCLFVGEILGQSALPPISAPLLSCCIMAVCLNRRFPLQTTALIGCAVRSLGFQEKADDHLYQGNTEVSKMKTSPERQSFIAQMAQVRRQCPELPPFPEAFRQAEYDGWFQEAYKRWQLQAHTRTHSERAAFLKQIDELQQLSLNIMRKEGEYQRFDQEQRAQVEQYEVDAKRRKLESLKLDMELEAIEKERTREKTPPLPSSPRDPIVEAVAKIRAHMRTEAGIRAEFKSLIEEFPAEETYLNRECSKIINDLRERR